MRNDTTKKDTQTVLRREGGLGVSSWILNFNVYSETTIQIMNKTFYGMKKYGVFVEILIFI